MVGPDLYPGTLYDNGIERISIYSRYEGTASGAEPVYRIQAFIGERWPSVRREVERRVVETKALCSVLKRYAAFAASKELACAVDEEMPLVRPEKIECVRRWPKFWMVHRERHCHA